jgi:hypothetical protein
MSSKGTVEGSRRDVEGSRGALRELYRALGMDVI